MKSIARLRAACALLVLVCMLASPVAAIAKKGENNYKRGLQYEAAQKWEKAAQEFTLAVAADPSNVEYQLHYRRAVFNASQSFMQQGRALAEQQDFVGAYNAFRQAYGYDPVNQLALSEMERMVRLQRVRDGLPVEEDNSSSSDSSSTSRQTNTSSQRDNNNSSSQDAVLPPPRTEQLRVINYSGDLKSFIRSLAEQLNLNVVFDSNSFRTARNIDINLRDVTTAQALDYIFLQEGLFFQKLSRRTVLVANQASRPQYQQLVIRTFYLSNVDPTDASNLITRAIPPQQGRPQTIVIPDKSTNSLTIRDTEENIRLIGALIQSIDKDRAEVVMDVNIYEVSRTDLMQLGNQIGDGTNIFNLGGTSGLSIALGSRQVANAVSSVPTALGAALVIPASTLTAFQRRDRTKLIYSTQIHAFNGEESTTRIGQRVPVQTAQTYPFGAIANTSNNNSNNFNFGGGFPVINYEPTGLTLKFTPQVFPNLDVQVKMSIESKDVVSPGNTPTFTERTITGTARIQNNRTMMLASVAQDRQSNGRQGLPVLGLIPILGRLFATPRRDNLQTDIVIAVTPRVLRAPAVTPRDEELRPSGTLSTPTTGSLEALLQDNDREDQLAAARLLKRNAAAAARNATVQNATVQNANTQNIVAQSAAANQNIAVQSNNQSATQQRSNVAATQPPIIVQLQDADPPPYIPAPKALMKPAPADASGAIASITTPASTNTTTTSSARTQTSSALPRTVDLATTLQTLTGTQTVNTSAVVESATAAELRLMPERQEMRVGERQRIALVVLTNSPLRFVSEKLRFNQRAIAVRSITPGNLFAPAMSSSSAAPPLILQTAGRDGDLTLSVSLPPGAQMISGAGVLLFIEIEAIGAGESAITVDKDTLRLMTPEGQSVPAQFVDSSITVKP